MEEKMQIFLDRINFNKDHYNELLDAKLTKIKVSQKENTWHLFIEKDSAISLEILTEIETKKYNISPNLNDVIITYDIKNQTLEDYQRYYPFILNQIKDIIKVPGIFKESLIIEDEKLKLIARNGLENIKLEKALPIINKIYNRLGFKDYIQLELREEDEIKKEIEKSLEETIQKIKTEPVKTSEPKEEKKEFKQKYKRKEKDPNSVLGLAILDNPIKIKTIIGEDNNVTVEAQVFGTEYFESSKSDFKIITLKLTDFSDSIYCKVFVRDNDEYIRLCKELKAGKWFKIRGYTKNDPFSKELVLNARDIIAVEHSEEAEINDTEEIKRVEKFGVKKIVLHPGSYTTLDIDRGIKCIINALNEVLKDDSSVSILLETMAGKGTEIGFKLEHLKRIIDGVSNKDRLMVCLDTCHLNDAGYDMSNFDVFLDEFNDIIGIEKIGCIHINDSKNILSSNKDRHENIGYGMIGFENLLNIIYNERLNNIPKILETPYVKDRLYPPYKFEIEEIKNKKFNSNLYEDIINHYEKKG